MKRSMTTVSLPGPERLSGAGKARKLFQNNWRLYALLLPALIWLVIFCYVPMYGVLIAFKDYSPKLGILHSHWADPWYKYLQQFFSTSVASRTISNTIILSLYSIAAGFPAPILFALLLNQLNGKWLKRFTQNISFVPHFISTVVMVGVINLLLSPNTGILNQFLTLFTDKPLLYTTRPEYFRAVYVWSGVWQGMGFGAIVYIAALAGINPELHEAAIIDGASKLQCTLYIDIPSIMPTIIIMFILSMGGILSVGYEKAFLMQNTMNTSVSEIISTYVYKVGILNAQYSFSTAVGLFNSLINFAVLILTNFIVGRVTETSMF